MKAGNFVEILLQVEFKFYINCCYEIETNATCLSDHPFAVYTILKQDGSMNWESVWSRRTIPQEVLMVLAVVPPSEASTSLHSTSHSAVSPAWASAMCQPTLTLRRSSQFVSCL